MKNNKNSILFYFHFLISPFLSFSPMSSRRKKKTETISNLLATRYGDTKDTWLTMLDAMIQLSIATTSHNTTIPSEDTGVPIPTSFGPHMIDQSFPARPHPTTTTVPSDEAIFGPLATNDRKCPVCKGKTSYITPQTAGGDESMTVIFYCQDTSCGWKQIVKKG